jgi:molybdopterin/thiamine biosynthesis adenylyltransferase
MTVKKNLIGWGYKEMSLNTWRQDGIVTQDNLNQMPVTVIGAGGIGSPTTIALAKMGIKNITVYDPDYIEDHNLPNQFYQMTDIGRPKVIALKDIVENFSGTSIETKQEKFENQDVQGLVVSGVDSMDARMKIWEEMRWNPNISMYIEARMGAELALVHAVNPCDPDEVAWYETTLYSDADATEAPCTERSIIYNVFSIAGLIASQAKKFFNNENMRKEIIFDLSTLTLLQA